uniref:pyocin knob domain-containing protein n=1 Tax=Telmatospirillum sp. J64-1 TaxID=2502183 RepID=UPI001C8F3D44
PGTLTAATTNAASAESHTHNIDIATQAEAEAGTNTTKLMTPQRVAQHLAARLESALPGRLGVRAFDITDWNNALENGWYMASGAANAPPGETGSGAWWMGFVERHNELYVTQTVHAFSGNSGPNNTMVWRRRRFNGTWSDWYKLQWSQQEQDARYALKTDMATAGLAVAQTALFSGDPNTLTVSGMYYVRSHADLPVAADGFLLVEASSSNQTHKQTFTPAVTNRTFIRRRYAGVWSSWSENITTGNIGNYANFTKSFRLPDQTYVAWGSVTANHGLGAIPKLVVWKMRCVTAELTYSVGDEIYWFPMVLPDWSNPYSGGTCWATATQLGFRFSDRAPWIVQKTATSNLKTMITPDNWRFYAEAYV